MPKLAVGRQLAVGGPDGEVHMALAGGLKRANGFTVIGTDLEILLAEAVIVAVMAMTEVAAASA